MKTFDKDASYLVSRIEVDAKLLTSMKSTSEKLACYPNLLQTRKGTGTSYLLCSDYADHFYSLQLDKNSVSICIHSKSSPLYFMQEGLLRLLSIFQILTDDYEIKVRNLLPYLTTVLARQQINHYATLIENTNRKIERQGQTDLILAKRISALLKENAAFGQQNSSYASKIKTLTVKLIILEHARDASISFISKDTGLKREDVTKSLSEMQEFGYKVVYKNSDRFELVRI